MSIDQILYIGPWFDLKPINIFNKCKKFIYIDLQPRTQFDCYDRPGRLQHIW